MSTSASIVSHALVLPLLIALLTASLTLLSRQSLKLTISLSLLGTCAYFASIISLLFSVQHGPLVYQFSAWPAPYASCRALTGAGSWPFSLLSSTGGPWCPSPVSRGRTLYSSCPPVGVAWGHWGFMGFFPASRRCCGCCWPS